MFKFSQRDVQKEEIKSDPLSETMLDGSPCLENTNSTKIFAKSMAVAVVYVLMKRLIFENLSTTTKMASKPFDSGS